MEKIASFTVNHLDLLPGVYVSRKDHVGQEVLTTFDLRMCAPNREPVMNTAELHTIEHLAATYLRNEPHWKEKVIYFGPMGCRTGCYLILAGDYQAQDAVPLGQREKVSIYGDDYDTRDGTCVRDYIHVTDLAQAHILAMEYLNNGGESNIFNLGNGVGFTVKEVIDTARKVTGHPIPAQTTPRRAGDPAQLVASSEKAKTILGWKPQYDDLETIIASAWKWHESHPNGYGK